MVGPAAAVAASAAAYLATQGIHYVTSEGIPTALYAARKRTYRSKSKTGRRAYKVLTGIDKAYNSRGGRLVSGFAAHMAGGKVYGAHKQFMKANKK